MKYAWGDGGGFIRQKNGEDLSSFELDDVILNVQGPRCGVRKQTQWDNVELTAEGHRRGDLDRFQRFG